VTEAQYQTTMHPSTVSKSSAHCMVRSASVAHARNLSRLLEISCGRSKMGAAASRLISEQAVDAEVSPP
jgi:hypothetical protein